MVLFWSSILKQEGVDGGDLLVYSKDISLTGSMPMGEFPRYSELTLTTYVCGKSIKLWFIA